MYLPRSSVKRIDLIRQQLVFLNGFGNGFGGHCAIFTQGLERSHHDVVAVHLKVLAQLAAEIAAAKTVGTQHFISATPRDVGADLFGIGLAICAGL